MRFRVAETKSPHELHRERLTVGQRTADAVAAIVGSWPFIMVLSASLAAWIALNVTAAFRHWDPYPFILLNLMLSFLAAYQAPVILMSQNRMAEHDRIKADQDYRVNLKAEQEIEDIQAELRNIQNRIDEVLKHLGR